MGFFKSRKNAKIEELSLQVRNLTLDLEKALSDNRITKNAYTKQGKEISKLQEDLNSKTKSLVDLQNELNRSQPELDKEVLIASVRDKIRLEEIIGKYKPNVIFHAAAHKHVPLMEVNPQEAIKNNVVGTLNVAESNDIRIATPADGPSFCTAPSPK